MSAFFETWLGRQPRALLFDLDGTLVDSVPDIAVAVDAMLQSLGYMTVGETNVRRWVGNGAKKLVERALAHVRQCNTDSLDQDSLGQAHSNFLLSYGQSNGNASLLYPGVRESLQYWQGQGVPMAIVTNKPIQFVPHLLDSLGIGDCFELLLGGECVAAKKPDPQMLLLACEKLCIPAHQAVMIGDSRNDIVAAQSAGMPVVAVNYGYNYDRDISQESPDRVVSDLRDLLM